LLQFVELTDLHVEEAYAVQPQAGAQSLVDGTGTSLISVIDEPQLHLVTVAFDLMRSDLPLRVAFPVFMNNLLRWLRPQQDETSAGYVQAGMAHAVFFDKPVTQATVQDP